MFTHSFSSAASPGKLLNEELKTQADPGRLLRPELPYEKWTHTVPANICCPETERLSQWGQQNQTTAAFPFTADTALYFQSHLPFWMKVLSSKSRQPKNILTVKAAWVWFSPFCCTGNQGERGHSAGTGLWNKIWKAHCLIFYTNWESTTEES